MPNPPPSIAIVTCIKNEGEDLVEWLCFHRQIGVSRFVIYDNLSTDATRKILESVPFQGEIVVHRIAKESPQKAAFADALRRYATTLDWVAFIDGDEYIVPVRDVRLPERIASLETEGFNGLGVHWRIFGSSGHETRPPGLVTENFIRRAHNKHKANRHVKSIVKISKVREMVTQHYFRVEGAFCLDDRSEPSADFAGVTSRASFKQGFAIHHYITKSRAQCMAKIARGRPKPAWTGKKYRSPGYFEAYDCNDVEDLRAAEVIAPIRDEVLRLRDEIGRD